MPEPYDVIPPRAEASELLSPATQRSPGKQPRCLRGRMDTEAARSVPCLNIRAAVDRRK